MDMGCGRGSATCRPLGPPLRLPAEQVERGAAQRLAVAERPEQRQGDPAGDRQLAPAAGRGVGAELDERTIPAEPIAGLAPDLAVEMLSKGNTKKEMSRKRHDYFFAGVRLVWLIDPSRRTVEVWTAPDQSVLLTEEQTLDGGHVLPGFSLPVKQIFAALPPRGGAAKKTPRRRKHS